MPERINGGVFNQQVTTGSQRYFVIEGADFSGAVHNGQPVAFSSAEIIFNLISQRGYTNTMNPYSNGISFSLEIDRSDWDANTLQNAIQSLGSDVGVDHVDCSVCTVTEVPFNFQYLAGSGSTSFIGLDDVTVPSLPDGYVKWDLTGTVLEYSTTIPYSVLTGVPDGVSKIIAGSNITISPTTGIGDVTINASGTLSTTIAIEEDNTNIGSADTINFTGSGVSVNVIGTTATVNIPSSTGVESSYIPVPPGSTLAINKKYFVTAAGTVFLPSYAGASIGTSIVITKSPPNTSVVFVVSADGVNSITTDIGNTDSIEIDATIESNFIYNGTVWALQIGSIQ